MSFIIRQIALKNDGGEIVRATQDDNSEIFVGRSAENAVHLPDLAVSPVHASIKDNGDGTASVASQSGLSFDVDGKSAESANIDVSRGAELRFGGHVIAVGKDAETGAIGLTVRRVEALSESAEEINESKAYSLTGLLPGKRISAWTFVVLVIVAFLAWPVYTWATYKPLAYDKDAARPAGFHADAMWSSGKLSLAHQSLKSDCQACHVDAFVAVRDNACLTCHTGDAHDHAPQARLLAARGKPTGIDAINRFVAASFHKPAGRCVECHTEHEGAGAMQSTQQRFCADCHEGMDGRLTDTALMNASDFGTAHPQFRPALMTRPGGENPPTRRVSLDRKPTEYNGLKFPHDLHLDTRGGVAQMGRRLSGRFGFGQAVECQDCHESDANGVRFLPVDMEENCSMCHSLVLEEIGGTFRTLRHGEPELVKADLRAYFRSTAPDRPINLGGMARRRPGDLNERRTASDYARAVRFRATRADEAIRAVFSRGGACYDCHGITNEGGLDYRIAPVSQTSRYMHKGWFTHEAHNNEACESCHAAPASSEAQDLLLPGIATCRECHVGESGAALTAVLQPVESTCAMCHDYHADDGAPWLMREQQKKQTVALGPKGTAK